MGYIFDPQILHEVAKRALVPGGSLRDKVARIREDLGARYPGHIRHEDEWVFNIAGGALGQMTILHASITEYVIVFGSPIGTEGYSGRFLADDYFVILEGEQWAYGEGDEGRLEFRAGDLHHLPRGEARGYRMPDRCYALEYARGLIPTMLPFGLADSFTSTLDPKPVMKTMRIYARAVVGELLRGKIRERSETIGNSLLGVAAGWPDLTVSRVRSTSGWFDLTVSRPDLTVSRARSTSGRLDLTVS